jgi:pimeloyl-ACP methyl ester carboxylesterase
MEPVKIIIKNRLYRYAFYKNSHSNDYGIFLMGTLQDIESVNFFSHAFSQKLNLFVIEVPGTGLTTPLPAMFSMQDQADMLCDFIEHMRVPDAHVFSFSYSVPIALELCTKIPNRIHSLSMYGGMTGVANEFRSISMGILHDAIYDRKNFGESFINMMMTKEVEVPRSAIIARSAKQKILKQPQSQIDCFCENTIRLLSYKPSEKIPSIQQPCMLIIGKQDPYVTLKQASELAQQLPNCTFEIIPNADHLAHIEYPDIVAGFMMNIFETEFNKNKNSKMFVNAA